MAKIEIKNLTKKYGRTTALENVCLTLEENKIYGLLGRNGAGKTTLLNILSNKTFPTAGQITVDGEKVWENNAVLQKIFYMMEQNFYPDSLRIKEVFKWTKEFYPSFDLDYAHHLADLFELNTNRKFRELSTGYTTIAKAICALASNGEIVLYDEPILGLDANHRELLYREILSNYIAKPKTVIISTHLIGEVADLLEEVVVIERGQIILNQAVEDLLLTVYQVSGVAEAVDEYLLGKEWIGAETLHNFKSAIVLKGEKDLTLAKSLNLAVAKVELQTLFIALTGGRGKN